MKKLYYLLFISAVSIILFSGGYFLGGHQYISYCEKELANQYSRSIKDAEDAVNSLGISLTTAFESLEQEEMVETFEYARAEAKYAHELMSRCYHQGYNSVIESEINRDDLAVVCDYFNFIRLLLNEIGEAKEGQNQDYNIELLKKVSHVIYGETSHGHRDEHLTLEKLIVRCDSENPDFMELKSYLRQLLYQEDQ